MTAIRINTEHKTILDFSDSKFSKHEIIRKLKSADFIEFKNNGKSSRTYLEYDIKIGIYTIFVGLFHTQSCGKKLKDYDRFFITIYEGNNIINDSIDTRFSSESWILANSKRRLKISHLAAAIMFCSKLHNLKSFL